MIDNIGMLSRLYRYATVAYVGGGYGADGVHNVLEAILNRLLTDEGERINRGEAARQFVYENAGASKKIIEFIQEKRLLVS